MGQISFFDNFIVGAYLILILCVGIFSRKKLTSLKNFASFKNSFHVSKLTLVATIFASAVGGGTTFGLTEKVFATNLATSYALWLTIPVDLLIAYLLIPKIIKHQGIQTIGDLMEKFYDFPGRFIGGCAAIIVSLGYLAAQISVSGRIFQYILNIDYVKAIILSYGIIIVYTTIGGLRSVITTNILQFFAMIITIPIITFIGINYIGFESFITYLPMEKIFPSDSYNFLSETISIALGFAVIGLLPNYIQRVLIANDANQTIRAIYYKSAIYSLFLVFITLNGLIAYELFPEVLPSQGLPYLIDFAMPVGIKGLVVAGLLAAVMSTADSDLNVISVSLSKDIIAPFLKITNEQKLLYIAQVANIIVGTFAIVLALKFSSVVDLIIFIAGFWGPIILVPLIFCLYEIKISKIGFVISCFAGLASFIIWQQYFSNLYYLKSVFVGTLAHFIVFIVFLLSKKLSTSFQKN